MNKILVKYQEDFNRMGRIEGLFICTEKELDTLIGKYIYFGELLGKHSEIDSHDVYENCEIVSECPDLIYDLETVFDSKTFSGINPFDYLEEEDFDEE